MRHETHLFLPPFLTPPLFSQLRWAICVVCVSCHILFMRKEDAVLRTVLKKCSTLEGWLENSNFHEFKLPPHIFPLFSHFKSASSSWLSCQIILHHEFYKRWKNIQRAQRLYLFWIPVQVWYRWVEISFSLRVFNWKMHSSNHHSFILKIFIEYLIWAKTISDS